MIDKRSSHCSLVRGMRYAVALLAFAAALFGAEQSARAGSSRIALVIGIGAYQNVPALVNPTRDAKAVSASLRNLGFDVEERIDPGYTDLKEAVRQFGKRADKADAAVIFYAGHGMQVEHENFLIPVDAQLERERDLLYETLKLDIVLGEAGRAKKVGLVILDACRNNPLYERVARTFATRGVSITKGLAKVDNVPPNTAVAMATRGDATAEDGSGEHSPYTAAILAHLEVPGLELGLFFRSVRDTVLKATSNRQEPYFASSLGAEPFYFYPPQPKTEVRMDAIRRATEGNAEIEALVKTYVEKLIDERLAPTADPRVMEIKHEALTPERPTASVPQLVMPALPKAERPDPAATLTPPPPKVAEPPPPPKVVISPAAVAIAPAAPSVKPEVKPNVKPTATDEKRKPPRDYLCVSIIERSQVGEPLSDAERIYLQKCGR